MRFLVDAQLPARLAHFLNDAGHDAVHTSQLAEHNRTSDAEVNRLADEHDRVVLSKDRDFRDSHLLHGTPRYLMVIATGNITNTALLALFDRHLTQVINGFDHARFVELGADALHVYIDEDGRGSD